MCTAVCTCIYLSFFLSFYLYLYKYIYKCIYICTLYIHMTYAYMYIYIYICTCVIVMYVDRTHIIQIYRRVASNKHLRTIQLKCQSCMQPASRFGPVLGWKRTGQSSQQQMASNSCPVPGLKCMNGHGSFNFLVANRPLGLPPTHQWWHIQNIFIYIYMYILNICIRILYIYI